MATPPPTKEELLALRNLYNTFHQLPDDAWDDFASRHVALEYNKGDCFVEAGKTCTMVGSVQRGLFKTYYPTDASEVVSGFFYQPGFITEYTSFLQQKPSRLVVEALEPSRIVCISFENLQEVYRTHGVAAERLGRLIAEQLFQGFAIRTASLMLDSPDERYKLFEERSGHLLQRVPLYLIASYLGMTPETLSRVRARIMKVSKQS